ncbi:type III CRISPR-associated RAMP protein Csx7 [Thermoflexus hugenholtzii]|uniref:CRISPR-associated RAMP protein, SSO1426 family n=1 Tax=Thermoflexus hugenholtzii JAD2 TaxID=877466 RepID=A0A212RMH1_9CHLR|nr:CRISPR-associated RAMP protein Csx7 [Thermoflexus hugenholtzii]SNB73744.1 CRISPR-associated RAMP protein, SSO1426 family [Thermoflexus hugenholtzii JAD2]
MHSFWHFENRWLITATLRMKTALSVGTRASLMPAGSDLPVIKTPEGIPFIPGSSLKGVARAYVERLLRTVDKLGQTHQDERLWACDPLDESECCVIAKCCEHCENCKGNCCHDCSRCKNCMVKRAMQNNRLDDEKLTQEIWQRSCTACRLFGSPWLASRISFQDAMLLNRESLLRLTEIRDGVGIDRDLGSAKSGIKYDFETVPAGAEFGITIVVENADEWEVGLLLLALEAMRKGELPVGGKTTRGPGWGEIVDLKIQKVGKENLLDYLTGMGQPAEILHSELLQRLVTALQGGSHA